MLRAPADFEALQRHGRSRGHPLVAVRFHRTGGAGTRFGLSTGRRLGGAVDRNRVRRRVRAILRSLAARTEPGWDVLVVCRPAAVAASHRELAEALEGVLTRAGVVKERSES
jgi:ribonuclease P protein component